MAKAVLLAAAVLGECADMQGWLRATIAKIAASLDERALEAAYTSDATQATVCARQQGKMGRRTDEDLQQAIIVHMQTSGRAKSSREAARAVGQGIAVSAVSKRDLAASLTYQWQCWAACESLSSLRVSLDGKRLGQPAEETLVLAVCVFPANVAFFSPPMAPRGRNVVWFSVPGC